MHVPPSHVRMELAVLTRWEGSSVLVPRAGLGHSVRDVSIKQQTPARYPTKIAQYVLQLNGTFMQYDN